MFERDELIELRKKANEHANTQGTNPDWVRAYFDLASAADKLDAMMARCEVTATKEEKKTLSDKITRHGGVESIYWEFVKEALKEFIEELHHVYPTTEPHPVDEIAKRKFGKRLIN